MAEAEISTVGTKACKACGEAKPLEKFPKVAKARDGRAGRCYACSHTARSEASKDVARARTRRWQAANADSWRETKRGQAERVRRQAGAQPLAGVIANAEARRASRKLQLAAERERRWQEQPWTRSGLTKAERFVLRYSADPEFNLYQRLRAALKRRRQGIRLGDLLRSALARNGASPRCEAFLGYTVANLRRHLERQFTAGMSWSAFCAGDIHLDHIVPLSAFDLSDLDALRSAWTLTNLRPLWARDNLAKAARRELLL